VARRRNVGSAQPRRAAAGFCRVRWQQRRSRGRRAAMESAARRGCTALRPPDRRSSLGRLDLCVWAIQMVIIGWARHGPYQSCYSPVVINRPWPRFAVPCPVPAAARCASPPVVVARSPAPQVGAAPRRHEARRPPSPRHGSTSSTPCAEFGRRIAPLLFRHGYVRSSSPAPHQLL
jgi:hypothetical protein